MRIAIVKLSALGDIIHAMVVLQFIKQHLPNSTVDWVVEQGYWPIILILTKYTRLTLSKPSNKNLSNYYLTR